jgi:hypothetical protein
LIDKYQRCKILPIYTPPNENMRTYEEIKTGNPGFEKGPFPLFENTDESAMSKKTG